MCPSTQSLERERSCESIVTLVSAALCAGTSSRELPVTASADDPPDREDADVAWPSDSVIAVISKLSRSHFCISERDHANGKSLAELADDSQPFSIAP